MPGIDGLELGRQIRARWPEIAVVLTSGYSHVLADDSRHGFPLLHKPYSVNELSRLLGEICIGEERKRQSAIPYPDTNYCKDNLREDLLIK